MKKLSAEDLAIEFDQVRKSGLTLAARRLRSHVGALTKENKALLALIAVRLERCEGVGESCPRFATWTHEEGGNYCDECAKSCACVDEEPFTGFDELAGAAEVRAFEASR